MESGIYPYPKDPDETLDYDWDFAAELGEGEGIDSHLVTVTDVTLVTSAAVGTRVVAWVSGGDDGDDARIAYRITTDSTPPRIFERTALLRVRSR